MTLRIAVVAPEELSKRKTYPAKVYAEAKALSKFGNVFLYGYYINPSDEYSNVELSRISEFSHSIRKSFAVYRTLFSTIYKSKYDVVFIPTVFNPLFPLLFIASKLASSIIIYDMRDSIHITIQSMKEQTLKRSGSKMAAKLIINLSFLVEKIVLRLSDYVLAPSPSLVKYAISHGKKSEHKVFAYHNFLPVKPSTIDEKELPDALKNLVTGNKITLVFFGQIQPEIRGIELIFKAIVEAGNDNVLFVLLGEIQDEKYWHTLIKDMNLSSRVIILKPKPKPEAMAFLRLFHYGILGPHPDGAVPSKIFDHLSVGNEIILPSNMTDALKILKGRCIEYKDTQDLVGIIKNLSKRPKKNSNSLNIPTFESSLDMIFNKIFHEIK